MKTSKNKFLPPIFTLAVIAVISGCNPIDLSAQPTAPALPLVNVSCNELSFFLDPALGSDWVCETVPESSSSDIPMDVFIYPEHTLLTIEDYPLTRTQFPAQVRIYPVDRFSELLPDVLPRRVSDLESITSGSIWSSPGMPFLPPLPMTQAFFTHEAVMAFKGGQGMRFITDYYEGGLPISNRTIFYTFQGLTADGSFWVAITLPISSPILLDDADFSPPEGYTEESWFQNYDSYVNDVKDALAAQKPASFFPTINSLDDLVSSITIGP